MTFRLLKDRLTQNQSLGLIRSPMNLFSPKLLILFERWRDRDEDGKGKRIEIEREREISPLLAHSSNAGPWARLKLGTGNSQVDTRTQFLEASTLPSQVA